MVYIHKYGSRFHEVDSITLSVGIHSLCDASYPFHGAIYSGQSAMVNTSQTSSLRKPATAAARGAVTTGVTEEPARPHNRGGRVAPQRRTVGQKRKIKKTKDSYRKRTRASNIKNERKIYGRENENKRESARK